MIICFTVSNALAKSIKTEQTFIPLSWFFLISSVTETCALNVDKFQRQPFCSVQSICLEFKKCRVRVKIKELAAQEHEPQDNI